MSATPADGAPLLEVADLCTYYGRIQALHGVSLSVPSGSLVALVGANGAGKTTVFNLLTGLYLPSTGRIFFE